MESSVAGMPLLDTPQRLSRITAVCACRAGGGGAREAAARAIVAAGVACMGHVGLMPQSISVLGGFRPHGQSAAEAVRVMREAQVRPLSLRWPPLHALWHALHC